MASPTGSDIGATAAGEDDQPLASVIHVGRHEDVATICGRLDTAPTYAVVISVPGGNRSLSREIGLRRVLRHAEESGRTIAFATTNNALSARARALRVPVARKPEYVRWDSGGRVIWRLGGRSFAVPSAGRLVQVLVIATFAALVALAALTIGPQATVVAYPPSEPLEQVVTVLASTNIEEPDYAALHLPAEEVSSSRLVTVVIPVTGTTLVGTVAAQLTVTATNTTADALTIPAGALLNTVGGVQFSVPAEVPIAAGETQTIPAVAVEPGEAGNVGPDSITGFADPAFALVRATNAGNGGGGLSEPRPAVSAADIVSLRTTASALDAVDAVRRTIVADRPHDAILLDTAVVDVDLGDPSPLPGTVADVVVMEVHIHVTALAIPAAILDELGRQVLAADDAPGELIPGSVTAIETGKYRTAESGDVTTELRLQGQFASGVTRKDVENAVSGHSTSTAKSILESRYGIQEAEVEVSPGWAPRLPRFGFRIDVDFQTPPEDDGSPPGDG